MKTWLPSKVTHAADRNQPVTRVARLPFQHLTRRVDDVSGRLLCYARLARRQPHGAAHSRLTRPATCTAGQQAEAATSSCTARQWAEAVTLTCTAATSSCTAGQRAEAATSSEGVL
eukprot:357633-Chlamydomonas_euryale.AAC.16